jgi:hypothetical protein
MELEEMGCPLVRHRVETFTFKRYGESPVDSVERINKEINRIIGEIAPRPRLQNTDYAFFLLDRLEEDLMDAFAEPTIWEECVMSARDRLSSLRKHLKGEL